MNAAATAISSAVNYIQPLEDERWNEFVQGHPQSSIFHSIGWLEALRRTYGYRPNVITTSPAGEKLQNGLVFCEVNSWLSGRRLVSLPFSDHCEPLVDNVDELSFFLSALEKRSHNESMRYVEIRPLHEIVPSVAVFQSTYRHYLHKIDLTLDLDTLFENCHKSSTQRKIRRAEKESLGYDEGRSQRHLNIFFRLLIQTRRRHQLPPQPKKWFQNLIECMGEALKIRIAFQGTEAIASILTIQFKDAMFYKYGCSLAERHELGGMHLLLWRSIEEAKLGGLREMDLGRSDCENIGLVTFKERWGSTCSTLNYARFATKSKGHFVPVDHDWKTGIAKAIFCRLPTSVLTATGEVIYKHLG